MPNYDFKKDLPIAQQTEFQVARLLETKIGARIIEICKTNKYDILANVEGKQISFEVKEDFSCERTGNVGLEFQCRGKDSGIMTSQADYYVYKIHTKNYGIKMFLLRTSMLKNMIKEREYFRIVNGGDRGSNSMNYLFKYETFIRNAVEIPFAS